MKDDYLGKEFRKDVASLEKNRKTVLKETAKSKDVYNIGLHRYIGYDRKVYFKDRLKSLKFVSEMFRKSQLTALLLLR